MSVVIHFTSSDAFMESDSRAVDHAIVEAREYVEATYETLRTGPDGVELAYYVNGGWELGDGRRFSDWAVTVSTYITLAGEPNPYENWRTR